MVPPQRLGSGNSSGSSYVGAGQTVGARALSRLLWSPSMRVRDIILEAMAELPDLDDSPPTTRWLGPSDTEYQLSLILSSSLPPFLPSSLPPFLSSCQVVRVKSPPPYGSTSTALETSSFSHPSHTPSSCQCAAPQHSHSQCCVQLPFSQDSVS